VSGGPHGLTASGSGGVLRVAGREAARLGRWSLAYTAEGWRLTAPLVQHDPHWLESGGPFLLRVIVGKAGVWTWRGLSAERVGWDADSVTVTGEGEPEVG
jgi:hypothetical protein